MKKARFYGLFSYIVCFIYYAKLKINTCAATTRKNIVNG